LPLLAQRLPGVGAVLLLPFPLPLLRLQRNARLLCCGLLQQFRQSPQ